jgi:drug/metabolite transporter (DMT)-like permease
VSAGAGTKTDRSALRVGFLAAISAAAMFGVSTPLIQRLGAHVGPFGTAALLYGGAALVALVTRKARTREAPVRAAHLSRIFIMALAGAVLAPSALAWGLQRTNGVTAGLALNLEAVFTALFGYLLAREHVSRRAAVALLMTTAAGALLVSARAEYGKTELLGMVAIVIATAGWGFDNALSSTVSSLDPSQIVLIKSLLGALLSLLLAWVLGESAPALGVSTMLVLVGVAGYGLSLRFYLLAQRNIGSARTASIFASAPFVAALSAVALGQHVSGPIPLLAGAMLLVGLLLHLGERHVHVHRHQELVHEHAHRHDDGHHDHVHEPPIEGEHSHRHAHPSIEHEHPHLPDLHHGHRHD